MSNTNKRKKSGRQAAPKDNLLEELDSLKELLFEQKRQLENAQTDIPILEDVIPVDPNETEIPVLEEVAFPEEGASSPPGAKSSPRSENTQPTEKELNKLVDMLVAYHLRRLQPKIKEEVIKELKRRHPNLF